MGLFSYLSVSHRLFFCKSLSNLISSAHGNHWPDYEPPHSEGRLSHDLTRLPMCGRGSSDRNKTQISELELRWCIFGKRSTDSRTDLCLLYEYRLCSMRWEKILTNSCVCSTTLPVKPRPLGEQIDGWEKSLLLTSSCSVLGFFCCIKSRCFTSFIRPLDGLCGCCYGLKCKRTEF